MSLRERANLLGRLLNVLVDHDVLDRVNPSSRFQLLSNAEKMDAAIELWHYHNTLLGRQVHEKSARHLKLLEECIERVLSKHGEALHGFSALRSFFKSHVGHLGELIQELFEAMQSNDAKTANQDMIVFEANRIILALFKGALRYRGENKHAYELDAVRGIEPWTGTMYHYCVRLSWLTTFGQIKQSVRWWKFCKLNSNRPKRPYSASRSTTS
jgi:hypothetical protein